MHPTDQTSIAFVYWRKVNMISGALGVSVRCVIISGCEELAYRYHLVATYSYNSGKGSVK